MKLLIIICFYIANFSFFIKSDCSSIKDFNPNISCPVNYYYNTIDCKCDVCPSDLINDNNCYSDPPKSLYFPDFNDNSTLSDLITKKCPNGKLTELDDEGNWLGKLECVNTSIIYNSPYQNNIQDTFTFTFFYSNGQKENIQIHGNNFNINYYYDSCIRGYYEKSCQYLANLCVMTIYSNNEICNILSDLSRNLSSSGIVDLNL